jgi:hypothetical protein
MDDALVLPFLVLFQSLITCIFLATSIALEQDLFMPASLMTSQTPFGRNLLTTNIALV